MRKIYKHNLFKIFTLNGISVLTKMIVSFLSVKLFALFLGPEGFTFTGNFKNFTQSVKSFSTLGFDDGIVTLVSKASDQKHILQRIYSTAFYSRLFVSLFICLVLFFSSEYVGNFLFYNSDFNYIIKLFAIVLPFYTINNLLLSILNGLGKFQKLILTNIISTVLGFIFLAFFVYFFKIKGAFTYLSIGESLIIVITLISLRKEGIVFFLNKIDTKILYKLLNFSIMVLASAIIVPTSNVFIRNLISTNINTLNAGYWDAVNRLSGYYMLIITSSISIYYLPRISKINTIPDFKNELKNYLKIFGTGFFFLAILIILIKDQIIIFVLTEEFNPVSELLIYQVIADFFKLIVLFFGYKMIADRNIKKYIFVEVLFYTTYICLSYFSVKTYGNTKHVLISYIISNVVVFLSILYFYRDYIFKKQ